MTTERIEVTAAELEEVRASLENASTYEERPVAYRGATRPKNFKVTPLTSPPPAKTDPEPKSPVRERSVTSPEVLSPEKRAEGWIRDVKKIISGLEEKIIVMSDKPLPPAPKETDDLSATFEAQSAYAAQLNQRLTTEIEETVRVLNQKLDAAQTFLSSILAIEEKVISRFDQEHQKLVRLLKDDNILVKKLTRVEAKAELKKLEEKQKKLLRDFYEKYTSPAYLKLKIINNPTLDEIDEFQKKFSESIQDTSIIPREKNSEVQLDLYKALLPNFLPASPENIEKINKKFKQALEEGIFDPQEIILNLYIPWLGLKADDPTKYLSYIKELALASPLVWPNWRKDCLEKVLKHFLLTCTELDFSQWRFSEDHLSLIDEILTLLTGFLSKNPHVETLYIDIEVASTKNVRALMQALNEYNLHLVVLGKSPAAPTFESVYLQGDHDGPFATHAVYKTWEKVSERNKNKETYEAAYGAVKTEVTELTRHCTEESPSVPPPEAYHRLKAHDKTLTALAEEHEYPLPKYRDRDANLLLNIKKLISDLAPIYLAQKIQKAVEAAEAAAETASTDTVFDEQAFLDLMDEINNNPDVTAEQKKDFLNRYVRRMHTFILAKINRIAPKENFHEIMAGFRVFFNLIYEFKFKPYSEFFAPEIQDFTTCYENKAKDCLRIAISAELEKIDLKDPKEIQKLLADITSHFFSAESKQEIEDIYLQAITDELTKRLGYTNIEPKSLEDIVQARERFSAFFTIIQQLKGDYPAPETRWQTLETVYQKTCVACLENAIPHLFEVPETKDALPRLPTFPLEKLVAVTAEIKQFGFFVKEDRPAIIYDYFQHILNMLFLLDFSQNKDDNDENNQLNLTRQLFFFMRKEHEEIKRTRKEQPLQEESAMVTHLLNRYNIQLHRFLTTYRLKNLKAAQYKERIIEIRALFLLFFDTKPSVNKTDPLLKNIPVQQAVSLKQNALQDFITDAMYQIDSADWTPEQCRENFETSQYLFQIATDHIEDIGFLLQRACYAFHARQFLAFAKTSLVFDKTSENKNNVTFEEIFSFIETVQKEHINIEIIQSCCTVITLYCLKLTYTDLDDVFAAYPDIQVLIEGNKKNMKKTKGLRNMILDGDDPIKAIDDFIKTITPPARLSRNHKVLKDRNRDLRREFKSFFDSLLALQQKLHALPLMVREMLSNAHQTLATETQPAPNKKEKQAASAAETDAGISGMTSAGAAAGVDAGGSPRADASVSRGLVGRSASISADAGAGVGGNLGGEAGPAPKDPDTAADESTTPRAESATSPAAPPTTPGIAFTSQMGASEVALTKNASHSSAP